MQRFIFLQNCVLFCFLQKGDVSHSVKPCKVFVFLKTCNVFFLAKGCSIPFCKTMQCLIFKIEECFFSSVKRGNLLLSELCTVSLAHLHTANTVTVFECSHTPVVKVLKAMRKLMNINVYLAESVWLCTIDDRAPKHNHSKCGSVSHDLYTL